MVAKVSIVVPIYNIGDALHRCVASILAQSYTNIEVILVDDGSTDDSPVICDGFADQDPRVVCLHTPNGGVAQARRLGVERSMGDYICFVDGDDALPEGSVATLVAAIENSGRDVVIGGYTLHDGRSSRAKTLSAAQYNQERYIAELLQDNLPHEPWGRIFRRELFDDNSFPQLKRGQDWLMNIEVAMRVRSVVVISDLVYDYHHRADSTMRTFGSSVEHERALCRVAQQTLERCGIAAQYADSLYLMALNQLIFICVKGVSVDPRDEWVQCVLRAAKPRNLYERVGALCLRSPLLQRFLQLLASFKRSL